MSLAWKRSGAFSIRLFSSSSNSAGIFRPTTSSEMEPSQSINDWETHKKKSHFLFPWVKNKYTKGKEWQRMGSELSTPDMTTRITLQVSCQILILLNRRWHDVGKGAEVEQITPLDCLRGTDWSLLRDDSSPRDFCSEDVKTVWTGGGCMAKA